MKRYRNKESFESKMLGSALAGLWGLVTLPFRKKGPTVDLQQFRRDWQEIERLGQGSIHEALSAVIKADSLVDSVLQKKVSGKTMGERLKIAQNRFSQAAYQGLWDAHKIRNDIAHSNSTPQPEAIHRAISQFRKALQEIGIL